MTEDDICGYEGTTSGDPCRHPAGSCPVPSHKDEDAENPQGRPTEFTDELAREAIKAVPDVKSKAGVERKIGVGEGTIDNWLEAGYTFENDAGEEELFFRAFRRARGNTEAGLISDGLYGEHTDASMVRFLLSTSFGHVKTEKQEVEHSSSDGFWQNSAQKDE